MMSRNKVTIHQKFISPKFEQLIKHMPGPGSSTNCPCNIFLCQCSVASASYIYNFSVASTPSPRRRHMIRDLPRPRLSRSMCSSSSLWHCVRPARSRLCSSSVLFASSRTRLKGPLAHSIESITLCDPTSPRDP